MLQTPTPHLQASKSKNIAGQGSDKAQAFDHWMVLLKFAFFFLKKKITKSAPWH
jgi:hypothetical protein